MCGMARIEEFSSNNPKASWSLEGDFVYHFHESKISLEPFWNQAAQKDIN